jgi:hypothetical protein
MAEEELLVDCYRSGQISERQWQEHLTEDSTLRDEWLNKIDADNSGWNPIS